MSEIHISPINSEPSSEDKKTLLRILWGKLRLVDRKKLDSDKTHFLKRNPFFENLSRGELAEVAKWVYERDYLANEYVFEMGQPGAALFIIQSGEVSIEIPKAQGEATLIALLGKAAFFGELALLNDDPRSASARAQVPTKIFALFQKDLERLSERHPEIASKIFKSLSVVLGKRLKATNEFLDKKLRSVA